MTLFWNHKVITGRNSRLAPSIKISTSNLQRSGPSRQQLLLHTTRAYRPFTFSWPIVDINIFGSVTVDFNKLVHLIQKTVPRFGVQTTASVNTFGIVNHATTNTGKCRCRNYDQKVSATMVSIPFSRNCSDKLKAIIGRMEYYCWTDPVVTKSMVG